MFSLSELWDGKRDLFQGATGPRSERSLDLQVERCRHHSGNFPAIQLLGAVPHCGPSAAFSVELREDLLSRFAPEPVFLIVKVTEPKDTELPLEASALRGRAEIVGRENHENP